MSRDVLGSPRRAKKIKDAWVIHHGRKLVLDVNGPAEIPAINEAAKAVTLRTKLGDRHQGRSASCRYRHKLNGLPQVL